jgi:hypothetical protein
MYVLCFGIIHQPWQALLGTDRVRDETQISIVRSEIAEI